MSHAPDRRYDPDNAEALGERFGAALERLNDVYEKTPREEIPELIENYMRPFQEEIEDALHTMEDLDPKAREDKEHLVKTRCALLLLTGKATLAIHEYDKAAGFFEQALETAGDSSYAQVVAIVDLLKTRMEQSMFTEKVFSDENKGLLEGLLLLWEDAESEVLKNFYIGIFLESIAETSAHYLDDAGSKHAGLLIASFLGKFIDTHSLPAWLFEVLMAWRYVFHEQQAAFREHLKKAEQQLDGDLFVRQSIEKLRKSF